MTFSLLITACNGSAPNTAGHQRRAPRPLQLPLRRSIGSTTPTGPAAVEFSSTQFSAGQAAGSISLTVQRTGSATAAASVVYGTVAGTGTAVAGSDYTFTKGTLNWAENDSTPRTISVPVSKVTAFSGTKSFTVQLWAPSAGLAVATPGSATAEIIGDKSESAGTLQFNRRQLYGSAERRRIDRRGHENRRSLRRGQRQIRHRHRHGHGRQLYRGSSHAAVVRRGYFHENVLDPHQQRARPFRATRI